MTTVAKKLRLDTALRICYCDTVTFSILQYRKSIAPKRRPSFFGMLRVTTSGGGVCFGKRSTL